MEVLVMVGGYAGQIRDVKAFHAHGMIERGEAIDPNAPLRDVLAESIPEVPVAVGQPVVGLEMNSAKRRSGRS